MISYYCIHLAIFFQLDSYQSKLNKDDMPVNSGKKKIQLSFNFRGTVYMYKSTVFISRLQSHFIFKIVSFFQVRRQMLYGLLLTELMILKMNFKSDFKHKITLCMPTIELHIQIVLLYKRSLRTRLKDSYIFLGIFIIQSYILNVSFPSSFPSTSQSMKLSVQYLKMN